MARRVFGRAGLLFIWITAVSFTSFVLLSVVLPSIGVVASAVPPLFGMVYGPALWLAITVSHSDLPLLEFGAFASVENALVAFAIAALWTWTEPLARRSDSASGDAGIGSRPEPPQAAANTPREVIK